MKTNPLPPEKETTMKPIRIQRKRTKGWKMPPNTVYVGRPSEFGNPYQVGELHNSKYPVTIEQAIAFFRLDIEQYDAVFHGEKSAWIRGKLKGKNLACWCPLDKPCHADILLKIANEQP